MVEKCRRRIGRYLGQILCGRHDGIVGAACLCPSRALVEGLYHVASAGDVLLQIQNLTSAWNVIAAARRHDTVGLPHNMS